MRPPYGQAGDAGSAQADNKYSAACLCGRVRLGMQVDPPTSYRCHCQLCTRLGSGARWACQFDKTSAFFDKESLPWLRWYSANIDTAGTVTNGCEPPTPCQLQCSHCGTWIATETDSDLEVSGSLLVPTAAGPATVGQCAHARLLVDSHGKSEGGGNTLAAVTKFLRAVAPKLDGKSHKGQAGRVGVIGGSENYTGAPYYSSAAALRVGAELVSVYTADAAAIPIKTYSPELMVSTVYRLDPMLDSDPDEVARMVDRIAAALPQLHALAVGPGLGRTPAVLAAVAKIIPMATARNLPLVIDADGLWLINQQPDLVRGCNRVILTPNKMEFKRLAKAVLGDHADGATGSDLAAALSGPIIVQKGAVDMICSPNGTVLECHEQGAPKRPGGLGDVLCGTVATLVPWACASERSLEEACLAACTITRQACKVAFAEQHRAYVTPDVLSKISEVFEQLCPAESSPAADPLKL